MVGFQIPTVISLNVHLISGHNPVTYLTNSGDINVCVVEEEEVDRATDADAVLTQRVVVFALRSKNALLLFGSCQKNRKFR